MSFGLSTCLILCLDRKCYIVCTLCQRLCRLCTQQPIQSQFKIKFKSSLFSNRKPIYAARPSVPCFIFRIAGILCPRFYFWRFEKILRRPGASGLTFHNFLVWTSQSFVFISVWIFSEVKCLTFWNYFFLFCKVNSEQAYYIAALFCQP